MRFYSLRLEFIWYWFDTDKRLYTAERHWFT